MEATQSPRKKAHQRTQPLDVFFTPKTVALVGATENPGSVGRTILWNLVTSPFGGTVYPVNPKRPSVLGVKAYASITDIPEQVDLAVIVTPPAFHTGNHPRVRRKRRERRGGHLGGLQGDRPGGRGPGAAGCWKRRGRPRSA